MGGFVEYVSVHKFSYTGIETVDSYASKLTYKLWNLLLRIKKKSKYTER